MSFPFLCFIVEQGGNDIIFGVSFISVETGIINFDNDVVMGFILQFVSFVGDGNYKEGCFCIVGFASIFFGVMCRWLLSLLNQKGEEVCDIHVSGLNCIVVCIDGLLAWVVGRDSKSPFIDPLLLLASTKSTDFYWWYVSIGASGARFVF